MLVLSRKKNEAIKIGNDIIIKVLHTKGGTVKLGIEAPSHVRVLRSELTEFDAVPVAVANREGNAHEPVAVGNSDETLESDCYFDFSTEFAFSTEYAVEIEDQMMCVATD